MKPIHRALVSMTKYRVSLVAVLAALSACGGGGSGGGQTTSAAAPFPGVYQWTFPEGARQDVSSLNLFPFNNGDRVDFDRSTGGVTDGTVTRAFSFPPGVTSTIYIVTETDSTVPGTVDQTKYQVSSITGLGFSVDIDDPLAAAGSAPGLFNTVPVLEEYVAPLYPTGSTRSLEAQGDLGADADSDGKSDSYRFTYSQVLRGFETLDVLGAQRQVAHFSNAVSLTIRYTTGKPDSTVSSTEETYFAPGIGLVKRDSGASVRDGAVVAPAYSMVARSATVAGVTYP